MNKDDDNLICMIQLLGKLNFDEKLLKYNFIMFDI